MANQFKTVAYGRTDSEDRNMWRIHLARRDARTMGIDKLAAGKRWGVRDTMLDLI